ncbi:amidase [bacterium]|nr:amidase [bacterium]
MELKNYDLTGLKKLQLEKTITVAETFEYFYDRIEKFEPSLNAVYGIEKSRILDNINKQSRLLEKTGKPFYLIPLPVKELSEVEGELTYYGSHAFKGNTATFTRDAISLLIDNGFYTFGRSKACEFGLLPYTVSGVHGPTKNPWNTELNSGGSSGGSGSMVAAGLAPAAYATDGGGSTRIPEAWCGAVGFKPSRGRLPTGPLLSYSFLATGGLITRSVRDQADVYSNIWTGQNQSGWIPPINRSPLSTKREPIKIGVMLNTPFSDELHPKATSKVQDFAKALSNVSDDKVEITEKHFSFTNSKIYFDSFVTVWASLLNGLPSDKQFEPTTHYLLEIAEKTNSLELQRAFNNLSQVSKAIFKEFNDFDFILTPTLPNPPPQNKGLSDNLVNPSAMIREGFNVTPYTPWVNVMGLPALSMPFGYWDNGTPFGVQIISTKFEDDFLLEFSSKLEERLGYETSNAEKSTISPVAPGF